MLHPVHNELAPPLGPETYAEFYALRKRASTMTAVAIDWLTTRMPPLLPSLRSEQSDPVRPFRVLSVGSGGGEIDREVLRALRAQLAPERALVYHALEPNCVHFAECEETLLPLHGCDATSVRVQPLPFAVPGGFMTRERYDLLLLSHVLYYFPQPLDCVLRALSLLAPSGRMVIIHQTEVGIPELQELHMAELRGCREQFLTTADIRRQLEAAKLRYGYEEIEAHLDVTECLRGSADGRKILSFCMECDVRAVPATKLDRLLASLQARVQASPPCRSESIALLREPIGVFLLDAQIESGPALPAGDLETIVDYHQLAARFDWPSTFQALERGPVLTPTTPLRVLDVACGTGRWLRAFLEQHGQELAALGPICYDLLDASPAALAEALTRVRQPFVASERHACRIEEAELRAASYDLIWCIHGVYTLPPHALELALRKLLSALKVNGRAFFAQAACESFYIDFYALCMRSIFKQPAGAPGSRFSSAEDVVEALDRLGLSCQVWPVRYEERIAAEDRDALAHYLLQEAALNSFSPEQRDGDAECFRSLTLESLWANPEVAAYLKSFQRGAAYYFPEAVWLISFTSEQKRLGG